MTFRQILTPLLREKYQFKKLYRQKMRRWAGGPFKIRSMLTPSGKLTVQIRGKLAPSDNRF